METKQLLVAMLTENTGKHFLDSGMENGRAWQRNQGKNFENEDRVSIDWNSDGTYSYATVSTFHYLSEVLSLDSFAMKVNSLLKRKRASKKDIDAHWVQDCQDIIEENYDNPTFNWVGTDVTNTYNYENNLSQVLLYRIFSTEGNYYVLLQIHGGADVRGGYTDTQCFKLDGYLTGNVDIYGHVGEREMSNTYNGYSMTFDDDSSPAEFKETDDWSLDFYVTDDTYMYEY